MLFSYSNVVCDAATATAMFNLFSTFKYDGPGVIPNGACGTKDSNDAFFKVNYTTLVPVYTTTSTTTTDNTTNVTTTTSNTTMAIAQPPDTSAMTCSTSYPCTNKLGVCNQYTDTMW